MHMYWHSVLNKKVSVFSFFVFQMTHISAIPLELIMYIFKWVVSTELDMKSLEHLGRVQRNCFITYVHL